MSDQLMPGQHVMPGLPLSYAIAHTPVQDGTRLVHLRIEHATGMSVFVMPGDFAKQLGEALLEQATGLTFAKPGDVPR